MAVPPELYREVVVIGNGPSAITLSYLLAGNWPYYSDQDHSNEYLLYRLRENADKSLVEQDLEFLSSGLEGRSSNPVSLLFDALNHPDADLGIENPSVLNWRYDCDKEITHTVLGRGLPGGCWQDMEGGILTISLGSWMELPNWSFRDWDLEQNRDKIGLTAFRQSRATVGSVARYYQDYVKCKGLEKFFINHTIVHSVEKYHHPVETIDNLWLVKGQQEIKNHETGESRVRELSFVTPNVVLATGISDKPNKLNVSGEDLDFVIHTLNELEKLIMTKRLTSRTGTLLIIGAGLSAADAVIAAHFHNIPTAHAFRRSVHDSQLIFNRLPDNMYPEYHKVHNMMRGDCKSYCGYKSHEGYEVVEIRPNRVVILKPVGEEGPLLMIKCAYVVVLIGKKPNLSFMPNEGRNLGILPDEKIDSRRNPLSIDPYTHKTSNEQGIFALGPLVGDNFVRFVQGGALAITNHVYKKFKES